MLVLSYGAGAVAGYSSIFLSSGSPGSGIYVGLDAYLGFDGSQGLAYTYVLPGAEAYGFPLIAGMAAEFGVYFWFGSACDAKGLFNVLALDLVLAGVALMFDGSSFVGFVVSKGVSLPLPSIMFMTTNTVFVWSRGCCGT